MIFYGEIPAGDSTSASSALNYHPLVPFIIDQKMGDAEERDYLLQGEKISRILTTLIVLCVQSKAMNTIKWSRMIGCGLLAGVVWIILGSVVTALLGRDFAALPNNHLGKPTLGFIILNAVLDLLEGISIIWLYAVIRRAMALVSRLP